MATLFKSNQAQANVAPAASGVGIQSSVYGKAIPIIFGTTRVSGNLGLYGNFTVQTITTPSGGQGGKGGGLSGGGGGKGGGGGTTTYNYFAAFALMLSEGPIVGVGNVWVDKNLTTLSALGFSLFTGAYGQAPWGTAVSGTTALGYSGFSYIAAPSYALGSTPQLSNHTVEVGGIFSDSVTGKPDADASLVLRSILTDTHFGAGFPPARLGDLTNCQTYTLAAGLLVSPAYDSAQAVSTMVDDLCTAINCAPVWSSGLLNFVPFGDTTISGNGKTYIPPQTPAYDLTDDDFIPGGQSGSNSSSSGDPVLLLRKRPADAMNSIKLEYLDRANSYAPSIVEAKEQALIDTYGLRTNGSVQSHFFCDAAAADHSANLQLRRQLVRNGYKFTLDQRYCLLDPMDIVTITDAGLGLNRQWVRILTIDEGDGGTLDFVVEEYLAGTGAAPSYTFATGINPYTANYNADPGNVNAPAFLEPPYALAGDLEVWVGLSGASSDWAGCEVYISTDGVTYTHAGRATGASRMGNLTATLASVAQAPTGLTVDQTHTLSVDLSQSKGTLLSGSVAQAQSLTPLAYVDGEMIAYSTATLTGANAYGLTYLVRGAYGTPITSHAIGSKFVRLDKGVFSIPFSQDRIGQNIYVKFASSNKFGGGEQSIASVAAYTYKITGAALSFDLPNVTNLVASYVANIAGIDWSEVSDFRPVLYEVRKGATWNAGQVLGRVAHPPFRTQGDGTYWVAAYSEPVANLQVYSTTPVSIVINGSTLTQNVIVSHVEDPGWLGALSSGLTLVGATLQTNSGIGGTYTIPAGDRVLLTKVTPCQVLISWTSTGSPLANNFLSLTDFLGTADLYGNAAAINANVYPEIRLSQDGTTWGPWQKYTSGTYSALEYDARMQVLTNDANTVAILDTMTFAVDVPDRDDHYNAVAVSSSGSTVTFRPDGSGSPAPFNGGPQGSGSPGVPHVQGTVIGGVAGDYLNISGVSLSGCTVQVTNAGVGVARTVNLLVQGY